MRLLQLNSTGDDVKKWQSFLFGLGFGSVEVNGKFDAATLTATRAWQKSQGLEPDGKVGAATYSLALSRGLAIVENQNTYPPLPDFKSPDAEARARMFGSFRYDRGADGTIAILDGWAQKNIVRVHVPQLKEVENAPADCRVYFHRAGAAQLQALFAAWEQAGLLKYILTWAGTFSPRMIRGSRSQVSNHAFASAFDINAAWNGLGIIPPAANRTGTVVPLVALANQHGFFWGGHYQNRKDGMHFELAVLNRFPPHASRPLQDAAQEVEKNPSAALAVNLPANSPAVSARRADEAAMSAAPDALPSKTLPVDFAPAENKPPMDNSSAQVAENIQNNVESRADEKAIEIAQNTAPVEVPKTEPTGFLGKLWKTIVGIFTGTIILPAFLQNGLDYNAALALILNLVRENFKYLFFGALLGLSVWYVTKKYNNFALTKLIVETNSDVSRKDVRLVETAKPSPASFVQKIF